MSGDAKSREECCLLEGFVTFVDREPLTDQKLRRALRRCFALDEGQTAHCHEQTSEIQRLSEHTKNPDRA